jgi:hypothetical protein
MQFRDKKLPDEIIRQAHNLKDKSNWKLRDAREVLARDDDWEQAITKFLYRPFDERWIFYHDALIERSRREAMRHMLSENLGLITTRQVNGEFRHALCSHEIINDYCTVSLQTRECSYLFPLYLYQQAVKPKKSALKNLMMIFEPEKPYVVRKPNLNEGLVKALTLSYRKEPSPEQIFPLPVTMRCLRNWLTAVAGWLTCTCSNHRSLIHRWRVSRAWETTGWRNFDMMSRRGFSISTRPNTLRAYGPICGVTRSAAIRSLING